MKNEAKTMEIDLVYLWVDGSDPVWQAKKNAFTGNVEDNTSIDCKGRHADNDELKHSLRSVEKYALWIRKIFIITDNQTPSRIDTANPKIKIINQNDILPLESLPCYNSVIIEYFLYKIPDLSEHFLYANDDMFFNATASPDFFFAKDGFPIVRLKNKPFGKWHYRWKKLTKKPLSTYRQTVLNAALLIEKKFGVFYSGMPHHNIDAYRKSDLKYLVENVFAAEIEKITNNHFRTSFDTQRAVFGYYALVVEHGHLKYVNIKESCLILLYRNNYIRILERCKPYLFCINDDNLANDNDRMSVKIFLETVFPQKSKFEK